MDVSLRGVDASAAYLENQVRQYALPHQHMVTLRQQIMLGELISYVELQEMVGQEIVIPPKGFLYMKEVTIFVPGILPTSHFACSIPFGIIISWTSIAENETLANC